MRDKMPRIGLMGLEKRERAFVRPTVDSAPSLALDGIVRGHRTLV